MFQLKNGTIYIRKRSNPRYKKSLKVKLDIPGNYFNIPGRLKQFAIFTARNLYSKITDRQYLAINLLEAPVLALILGVFTKYNIGTADNPDAYIFSENTNLPVFIFMGVIVALFLGMMVSAEEIIRDQKIIKRESFLNLSKFSYYNSKVVLLVVLSAIQTFSFVIIGNWLMVIKDMLIPYWLILFSTSLFSNLLGLNISNSLKSVVSIYILIPLLLVPQILLGGAMINFDKLNKQISSRYYVPFVGDIMASRWAYEALTVYQFKNNRFQKHLYDIENKESHASFMMNYLVPELQLKLNHCEKNFTANINQKKLENDLILIVNELNKIVKTDNIPSFDYLGSLNINSFNLKAINETRRYLNRLKKYYTRNLSKTIIEKDKILADMQELYGGFNNLLNLKNDHHNTGVAEIVLNKRDNIKIIEFKNNLIRKTEPVYKMPGSKYGRAHFFAPEKRIGNLIIDTYWFNLGIILLMVIVLYTCLIFELLKKLINFSGTIKISKLTGKFF